MEILVSRETLKSALGDVSGAIPTRTPKPILTNVLLTARDLIDGPTDDDSPANLQATDLEVGITRGFHATVKEGGSVVLPTSRFQAILSNSTAPDLTIRQDADDILNGIIRVRAGRAKWDLPSEDPALFPQVPAFGHASYHVVYSHDLREMIARTAFATDPESTRYALGGVLFELNDRQIHLVATDGRRLAEASTILNVEGNPVVFVNGPLLNIAKDATEQPAPVVPIKTLKLLNRLIKEDGIPIHIGIKPANSITFRTNRATIYSRIVEGRFPRYQDVYSQAPAAHLTLPAGPFLEALQSAAITTSDKTRGVDLNITPGLLKFAATAACVGGSEVELEISYDGEPYQTTFDPAYLTEMLAAVPSDTEIQCEFRKLEGNLFRVGDNYKYVVMPLARDR